MNDTIQSVLAKKIPIEHILAASRNTLGRSGTGGRGNSAREENVNLQDDQAKTKDACSC